MASVGYVGVFLCRLRFCAHGSAFDIHKMARFMLLWSCSALVVGTVYAYFYIFRGKYAAWFMRIRHYDPVAWIQYISIMFAVLLVPTIISAVSVRIQDSIWIFLMALIIGLFPVFVVDSIYEACHVRTRPYILSDERSESLRGKNRNNRKKRKSDHK